MSTARILALVVASVMVGGAVSAMANEGRQERKEERKEWNEKHPRRAEVNGRMDNQNRRINQEVKEGEMSRGEATKLHNEDRNIRREERQMASKDGGHITAADQRQLNRQENGVSQQIGR